MTLPDLHCNVLNPQSGRETTKLLAWTGESFPDTMVALVGSFPICSLPSILPAELLIRQGRREKAPESM